MIKDIKILAEGALLLVILISACAGSVIMLVVTSFDKDIMHSMQHECQDILLAFGCCLIFIAAIAAREKLLGRNIIRRA